MSFVRRINGRRVTQEEWDTIHPARPCDYEKGEIPSFKAVDMGWEQENNGRGRYISQLQRTPGPEGSDPQAFCRSQGEIIEKAKRRGLDVVKVR